ncbi:MAG: hypothetical protein NVSMB6_27940 [Burkholderiaceae bacterium]
MGERKGQEHVSTYIPTEVAAAFREWARRTDGNVAGALRRLVGQAVGELHEDGGMLTTGPAQAARMSGEIGHGPQIGFRLRPTERAALDQAARSFGTSPANWVRSLVLVHLARRPEWNGAELDALREMSQELREIRSDVTRMAQVLQDAVRTGACPVEQGLAAKEAAERVRNEMRRLAAVMTGNYDYWGLPHAERLTPAPGAIQRAADNVRAAEIQRKRRPRRRPAHVTQEG